MNQNIITLGMIEIRWYSVLILMSFMIGTLIIFYGAKRKQIDTRLISDLIFYLIITVIIGARIYYVLFNLDYYLKYPIDIIKIWEGGLAIHGGIIAGIIFLYYYCKKKNIDLLTITDIIAPALILGQAIGRWGNFFNQEAYGSITTYEALKHLHIPNFIISGMYINHSYWHPTFFYESIMCLIGFIIIFIYYHTKKCRKGHLTALYFIIYGIIRFFIESMRQDSLMIGSIKMAQIVSIIMILIGIVIFIYSFKKEKYDK